MRLSVGRSVSRSVSRSTCRIFSRSVLALLPSSTTISANRALVTVAVDLCHSPDVCAKVGIEFCEAVVMMVVVMAVWVWD